MDTGPLAFQPVKEGAQLATSAVEVELRHH